MSREEGILLVVILRSSLCDYAILVKGTITITGAGDDSAAR